MLLQPDLLISAVGEGQAQLFCSYDLQACSPAWSMWQEVGAYFPRPCHHMTYERGSMVFSRVHRTNSPAGWALVCFPGKVQGTCFNVSKFSKKFHNEIIANFILKFFWRFVFLRQACLYLPSPRLSLIYNKQCNLARRGSAVPCVRDKEDHSSHDLSFSWSL